MALQPCTAPMQSPAWLTSFCSTSSVVWRSEAVTETPTWERLTTWVNGRHGSKPGPETTRLTLWSLPTSGSALAVSSAGTGTCPLTRFIYRLEDPRRAAELNLATLEALWVFGYYPACSSALVVPQYLELTRPCRIRPRTKPRRHSTRVRMRSTLTHILVRLVSLVPMRSKLPLPSLAPS